MYRVKSIRRVLAALLVAMLMMSACAPAALASYKAKVNSNTKVYSVPSTSGKSLPVPKGLTVSVSDTANGWAKISYKGVTAYIPTSRLNKASRVTAYTAKSTPVYKQASSSSSKIGTLSIGTKVYVVGKSGSYYRVQNSSGSVTGYIKSGYLTTKAKLTAAYNAYKKQKEKENDKPSSGGDSGSGSGGGDTSTLVGLMKSLVGRPYASHANAPKSFNCSAFVSYVLGKFGISTKATAKAQSTDSSMSKIDSISKLKQGDILCFDNDDNGVCDHTAIYAGNGVFYEASQSAKKVQKNTITSYYTKHFMWARRP